MEALRRFVVSIDRTHLRGVVVAVLLVNTPGFPTRTVFVNPRDGKNINRAFPGSKTGTPAERVTDFLMTELVARVDAYVDCRGGDIVEAIVPFTMWARTGQIDVDARSEQMAAAYGDSMIFAGSLKSTRGTSIGEAAALGIPAMLGEAGQQGICDDASINLHFRGMQSVLQVLGMADGPQHQSAPRVMAAIEVLAATMSGAFHPTVSVGETVTSGQKVGEVSDIFGEVLQEAIAPKSGIVICLLTGLAVSAGEVLVEIGIPG
jgi:hypothetical protein